MKRMNLILAAGFWAAVAGVSLAQSRVGMPVPRHSTKEAPPPAAAGSPARNPNMRAVSSQIRLQMTQIHKDLKDGKITKDQAKAKFEGLKAIRNQEVEFFKQNSLNDITDDQRSQLEKSLASN